MATEETEISELEFREDLSGDDLLPVETTKDTFATSLTKVKDWVDEKIDPVHKSGDEEISGVKTFNNNITAPNVANTELSNLADGVKETITGWGMPDYSAGVSYSKNTWILAHYDCFFTGGAGTGSYNLNSTLYVADDSSGTNSIRIAYDYAYAVLLNGFCPKGKYFQCSSSSDSFINLFYYPLKGAK
jgi:hypothetical protein